MTKPVAGDWVRTPIGVGIVSFVEERHATLPVEYAKPIAVQFSSRLARYSYDEAKKVSFLGFVFNGPLGWKGFGQNSMLIAVALHIFATAMIGASFNKSLSPEWSVFIFCFALVIVVTLWYMTWRNYKRKTV